MHDFAARVHEQVARLAPVVGVSIGRRNEPSTWRIDFADHASEAQRAAAASALAQIDVLSLHKDRLVKQIDADAETVRMKYLTPGHGMAQVYKEKQEQAAAVLAMAAEEANALPDHGAQQFPILAASVGLEAPTLYAVAELVWGKFEQFQALGFVIERTRLAAKKTVMAAADEAAATAAYEAIQWQV